MDISRSAAACRSVRGTEWDPPLPTFRLRPRTTASDPSCKVAISDALWLAVLRAYSIDRTSAHSAETGPRRPTARRGTQFYVGPLVSGTPPETSPSLVAVRSARCGAMRRGWRRRRAVLDGAHAGVGELARACGGR